MATTKLYLDTRGSAGENGSVKVVISHNRKSAYMNLGLKAPIAKWDAQHLCVTGSENRRLQLLISKKKYEIDLILFQLMNDGVPSGITALQLRDMITARLNATAVTIENPAPHKPSFMESFRKFIDTRQTAGTKAIYADTYKKVLKFAVNPGSLTFEDIDVNWLREFDSYLSLTMKSENSKSIHFRNLRAVFNAALTDEITEAYPFRRFKIKSQETEKRSLTIEQLRLFASSDIEPWMERYRDVFMLIFMLCGINITDLCQLKGIENGRIVYRRAKTHKLYSIKVEPEADLLISKYEGKEWLLNFLDCYGKAKDFNRKLKRGLDAIVEHINAGLPRTEKLPRISSYWARHTWATLAADLDIPIETISAALGHAHGCATTAIYIRFNNKKIDAANRKVLDWVLYDKR